MAEEKNRLAEDEQMPKIGALIDERYEIISILGEGGFAAVFEAFDHRTKSKVAVKVLDPIMSRRNEFSQRFLREVSTVANLQHHNTIKIVDSGTTDKGCLFLVMELLKGQPLDEILEEVGTLEPSRVKRIVQQVLKSLYEAHESNIIHRDLKPANVFIADLPGEKDYVKVLDFGIAKTVDDSQDSSLTATGQVMCSPDYVAPERVRDHVAMPASDIYSLGIMMIEMLEGGVPYVGDSPMMVALQHVKMDETVPLQDSTANGPLGNVIQRACSKDLSRRFSSAEEMLQALDRVSAAGAVAQTRAASSVGPPNHPSHTEIAPGLGDTVTDVDLVSGTDSLEVKKTNTWIPTLIAGLALVLAVGVAAWFLLPTNNRTTSTVDNQVATEGESTPGQVANNQEPSAKDDGPPASILHDSVVTVKPPGPGDLVVRTTEITSDPEGATLFINNKDIGMTPLEIRNIDIEEFPAELSFEIEGYKTLTQSVESFDQLVEEFETFELTEEPSVTAQQRAAARRRAIQRRRARAERQQQQEQQAAASQSQGTSSNSETNNASDSAEPTEDDSQPSRIINLSPRR